MFTIEISIRIILYTKYAGLRFQFTVISEILNLKTPNFSTTTKDRLLGV